MKKENQKNDCLSIKSKITLGIMFLTFLIGAWFFIFKPVKDQYDLKVGSLYKYEYNEDNPFEGPYVKYYRVINKRSNYVQYVDTVTKDTLNSRIRLFLYGSKKVE